MRPRFLLLLASVSALAATPGVAGAQDIESVAVDYLRPPAMGVGAVEIAVSVVGAGFHFDSAWRTSGIVVFERTHEMHIGSGVLSISRTIAAGWSIGALAGAKTMPDVFDAIGPAYLVLGAIDVAGAVVAISSALHLDTLSVSGADLNDQLVRSRTINQGWGVSMAILSGVEFVLGIAATAQGVETRDMAVRVVPTPGGFAIAGRFGSPLGRWRM